MKLKNTLDAADICAIVKACGDAGVSELRFLGLHIRIGPPVAKEIAGTIITSQWPSTPIIGGLPLVDTVQMPSDTTQTAPEDDDRLNSLLAVEDPTEWERRQLEDTENG